MPAPQTPWLDLLSHIASRERAIEVVDSQAGEYEPTNPYWDLSEVEQFLLEISQRTLRELPSGIMEQLGSDAVKTATYASGDTLPLNTVAIISALIQEQSGDTYWRPAQRLQAASQWYQTINAPLGNFSRYALVGGAVLFKGHAIRLTTLEEPVLDVWQSDAPVLPPVAYDEPRVSWVHEKLMIQDFMPGGRI